MFGSLIKRDCTTLQFLETLILIAVWPLALDIVIKVPIYSSKKLILSHPTKKERRKCYFPRSFELLNLPPNNC